MPNIDPSEIAKFSDSAIHWWDLEGEFKMLHELNPLRLEFITQKIVIADKKIMDVGCGGGILSESLYNKGSCVTGIDMSAAALQIAELHQLESGTKVEYLQITAEEIADQRAAEYDVVTCMEMLEHVPDPARIVQACAKLLKPGGSLFLSTLNRNLKSYIHAIIGAEYILKLLPKQTHDFSKFIKPSEIGAWSRLANLTIQEIKGIQYSIFSKQFRLTDDSSVNYLMYLKKNV